LSDDRLLFAALNAVSFLAKQGVPGMNILASKENKNIPASELQVRFNILGTRRQKSFFPGNLAEKLQVLLECEANEQYHPYSFQCHATHQHLHDDCCFSSKEITSIGRVHSKFENEFNKREK